MAAVIDFGHVRGPKGTQGVVGEQGEKGQTGVRGRTVNIVAGLHKVEDLPNFDDVESNTGYLVDDGDGRYDLYLKGKGTDWTVNENWQGPKGLTGDQGIIGPQGDQGEKGEQGPQGPQGLKGMTGDKGETGDKGIKGLKGLKAKPNFKIDDNGHVILEYDDSLKSPHSPVVDISGTEVIVNEVDQTNNISIPFKSVVGAVYNKSDFLTKNSDKVIVTDANGDHPCDVTVDTTPDGVLVTAFTGVALKSPATIKIIKGFAIGEKTVLAATTSIEKTFDEIQSGGAIVEEPEYEDYVEFIADGATKKYYCRTSATGDLNEVKLGTGYGQSSQGSTYSVLHSLFSTLSSTNTLIEAYVECDGEKSTEVSARRVHSSTYNTNDYYVTCSLPSTKVQLYAYNGTYGPSGVPYTVSFTPSGKNIRIKIKK